MARSIWGRVVSSCCSKSSNWLLDARVVLGSPEGEKDPDEAAINSIIHIRNPKKSPKKSENPRPKMYKLSGFMQLD